MTTLPPELQKVCEEMADKRVKYTYGGNTIKQYDSRSSFIAGFNAAYELMKEQNFIALTRVEMAFGTKKLIMESEYTALLLSREKWVERVSEELDQERAKSQKLIEALEIILNRGVFMDVIEATAFIQKALAEYRGEVTKLQVPEIEELNKQLAKDRRGDGGIDD